MEEASLRQQALILLLIVATMIVSCGRKAPPTLDEYSKEIKFYCKVHKDVGEDKADSQQ